MTTTESKKIQNFIKRYSQSESSVDIRSIVKQEGISMYEINGMEEVKGCYTQIDGNDIFLISNSLSEKEKRFTMAHELCHYVLGEKGLSVGVGASKDFTEKRADKFAMDLLCNTRRLKEEYENYGCINTLSNIFGVSSEVISIKLSKLYL